MTDQNQLSTRPETGLARVRSLMFSPEVRERFSDMMGANGIYYLNQVMIVVANSEDLQKCTPQSIMISAMRAASLRLSLDASQGQAWIIPYKNHKTGALEANYQTGYKGIYELAMRTNLYRFINVIDLYEGETLVENRMTGIHAIAGKRTGNTVWARMLYFQLFNGFEKTFVMTVEEIAAHAEHYSPGNYRNPKSKWNDKNERPKMERKTVLSNGLRKWGRFNAADKDILEQIENESEWVDNTGEMEGVFRESEQESHTVEQNLSDLGYDTPITADPTTGEVIENQLTKPAAMTIEEASKIMNSTGKLLLIDISTSQLGFMRDSLEKKHPRTPAQETELTAVLTIIKARLDGQQAAATQDRLI
jgi:recombination protein RecT